MGLTPIAHFCAIRKMNESKKCYQICEQTKNIRIFANIMIIVFKETYLEELYTLGKAND